MKFNFWIVEVNTNFETPKLQFMVGTFTVEKAMDLVTTMRKNNPDYLFVVLAVLE